MKIGRDEAEQKMQMRQAVMAHPEEHLLILRLPCCENEKVYVIDALKKNLGLC
jgi:hypothetical protein